MNKIKYSILIPVYNSSKFLDELTRRLESVMNQIAGKEEFEIIFVDDNSKDDSWQKLEDLCRKQSRVKAVRLRRNFGQHNSLMCGLAYARGELVVTMDDDLQNPPEEIPKLIGKIREGYDVVYGEYETKKHSFFRNIGSNLVQIIYKKTFKLEGNLTSFRILRRSIIKDILDYKLNYSFIDGLIAWQTDHIGYVKVNHHERKKGRSGYTFGKLFILSLNLLTNFSIVPLQLSSVMGIFMSLVGIGLALFIIFKKLFYGIPVTGFASTIVTITLFSGSQLLTIGLIGEYIGRIHLNINQKPQYKIRETKNLK